MRIKDVQGNNLVSDSLSVAMVVTTSVTTLVDVGDCAYTVEITNTKDESATITVSIAEKDLLHKSVITFCFFQN